MSGMFSGGYSADMKCDKVLIVGIDEDENPVWATQMKMTSMERRVEYDTTMSMSSSSVLSITPDPHVELEVRGWEIGEFSVYPRTK